MDTSPTIFVAQASLFWLLSFLFLAPLSGALEMVLEVVESELELDLSIGVDAVCVIRLLHGSHLCILTPRRM